MIQTVDVSAIHVLDSESSDSSEKYPKHSTPIKDKSPAKQKSRHNEKTKKVQMASNIPTTVVSPYSKHTQSLLSSTKDYDESHKQTHVQLQGHSALESSTIQKQRHEIQLLVAELRERDQELNEMVAAHQQQLLSWQQDRKRLLSLEQKCHKYKSVLLNRSQQLEKATTRLEDLETRCTSTLESSKEKLTQLVEESHTKTNLVISLEDRNKNLNDSLKEVSCTVGQMAAREQEIVTLLKLKDRELYDIKQEYEELFAQYNQMERRNSECHGRERDAFNQSTHWQQKYKQALQDIEKLDVDVHERDEVLTQQISQINEAQQHMIALQEALIVSNEREKCKDELLYSLKSKQERTVSELRSIRELYERQQRELTLLQLNLDTSVIEDRSLNNSQEHDISQVDPNIPELDQSNHISVTSQTANHSNKISFDDRLSRFLDMNRQNLPTGENNSQYMSSKGNNSEDMGNKCHDILNNETEENISRESIGPVVSRLESSPGSKLQRLLMESKNMIDSLEKSTLPSSPLTRSPQLHRKVYSKSNQNISDQVFQEPSSEQPS